MKASPLDLITRAIALLEGKKCAREQVLEPLIEAQQILCQEMGLGVPCGSKTRGTLRECQLYARSQELPESDGEWFFYKCEGSGWKNNGKAIADWRSTMVAWKLANVFPSQKTGRSGNGNGAIAVNSDRPKTRFIIGKEISQIEARISEIKVQHGQYLVQGGHWEGKSLPEPIKATVKKLRQDVLKLKSEFDNATI
jgi:hypothetical protein